MSDQPDLEVRSPKIAWPQQSSMENDNANLVILTDQRRGNVRDGFAWQSSGSWVVSMTWNDDVWAFATMMSAGPS